MNLENVRVLVAYATGEFGRRVDFYDYLNSLQVPPNHLRMSPHHLNPAKARNSIFEQALINNCTHVFLLDDDMAPKPDTLLKLLAHDVDVVSGLYLQRAYPHHPLAFSEFIEDGRARFLALTPDVDGLIEIKGAGFGCLLIKTDVIRRLQRPWVRLGELDPEQWCDDIGFFSRLSKELPDVKVYLDTTVRPGHIGSMIITPHRAEQGWMTGYDANGVCTIYHAQPNPNLLADNGVALAATIEGWMSEQELVFLSQIARDKKVIVEFGSHCGRSTRALADNSPANARIYAVDPWSGEYKNAEGKDWNVLGGSRFDDFRANLNDHLLSGKVIPVRKLSTDFALVGDEADLVFIDGDHQYETVLADIRNALRWTKRGGIIAGHDYNHESWPGVAQAVTKMFGKNFQVIGTIWYVTV